jgi:large subunit ribosomal protein L23
VLTHLTIVLVNRPNFTVALARTPHLPPNFAQFIVPLNINKLDFRDYLKHGYGIEVLAVRSYIQQQKVQRTRSRFHSTNYYRPRAIKKMTVELATPFVYPEEPKDLSPCVTFPTHVLLVNAMWSLLMVNSWDHELHQELEKQRDREAKIRGPQSYKEPNPARSKLRELAQKELRGDTATTTTEVEKDISIQ